MQKVFTISSSQHHPGSVSDLQMFQKVNYFQTEKLRKERSDSDFQDHGMVLDDYAKMWTLIDRKGY